MCKYGKSRISKTYLGPSSVIGCLEVDEISELSYLTSD